jgi:hypothetical protein
LLVPRGDPPAVSDEPGHAAWLAERKEKGQSDCTPLHLQRPLVIGCVLRNPDGLRLHSFVDRGSQNEGQVMQKVFHVIEKHQPQRVSWNGSGFDLPVMHHQSLRHGMEASKYGDPGEDDRECRCNNCISRHPMRHLDVMDLLAMYSPQNSAPLDAVARLCGVPGKLGLDGWQAYAQFLAHEIEAVRRCCETYVMNTHLVCCRFQKMRGGFTEAAHHQEIAFVKETLNNLAPAKSHRYG